MVAAAIIAQKTVRHLAAIMVVAAVPVQTAVVNQARATPSL
tara:strand:+ start:27 stop:149 length:123 start_codon:yes stop_codon:yes gene_type:complete